MSEKALPGRAISLEYIAGFVDGEGTITIDKHRWRKRRSICHYVTFKIGNTNLSILEAIRDFFACGTIKPVVRKEKAKQLFLYRIHGYRAVEIIRKLFPFIIIKIRQAKLALSFSMVKSCVSGKKLSIDEIALRDHFKEMMVKLNRRGT